MGTLREDLCTFIIMCHRILLKMGNIADRGNQNTHFMRKCGIICRPRQATCDNVIRQMHIVCWITKATDTHSECVILIAFPWQQCLCVVCKFSVLSGSVKACIKMCLKIQWYFLRCTCIFVTCVFIKLIGIFYIFIYRQIMWRVKKNSGLFLFIPCPFHTKLVDVLFYPQVHCKKFLFFFYICPNTVSEMSNITKL